MSIPTVPVTVRLFDQDGNPVAGATVTAKLTTTERYGGYVVPKEYRGETDANGVAVVNVFPNELGTEGSEYRFKILDMATGKTVSVYATVPNAPCELHQISELEPYLFKHSSSVVPVANGGTGRSDGVFPGNAATASDMAAGHVLAGKTTAEAVRGAIAAPSPNVGKYMITHSSGTGAQGLAAGTWTDVLQGTSSPYGNLGATDPGTGVLALRVPESGTYMIKTCALVVASTMGHAVAGIAKNGTVIIVRGFGLVSDGTWVQIICSIPLELEANDVVSVKVWCSVAANIPNTDSFIELVRIR